MVTLTTTKHKVAAICGNRLLHARSIRTIIGECALVLLRVARVPPATCQVLLRVTVLTLVSLMGFSGCDEKVSHDEKLAAKRAVEFAEIAFVRHELEKAYALLAGRAKGYIPMAKFEETVPLIHPWGYPTKVRVHNVFVLVAGEKAMYIQLVGEGADRSYNYFLILEGTATSDYRVSCFSSDWCLLCQECW